MSNCWDAGFTLIELVVTVSIVGIIAVPLTGVVIEYFKTTVATSARLSESHDVQFVAAYWQRDVASIGVRSPSFVNNTYALQQSVFTGNSQPACPTLPSGTRVVTLAWSSYALDLSASSSQTVTAVTYVAAPVTTPSGTTYQLFRVGCSGSTISTLSRKFTLRVADHLTSIPVPSCTGVSGCNDSTGVPTKITLPLMSTDPNNNDHTTYQQTLLGERRQT